MVLLAEKIVRAIEAGPQHQAGNSDIDIRLQIVHASAQRLSQRQPSETPPTLASPTESIRITEEDPRKIIKLPQFEPMKGRPSECFAAIQEWEGFVTYISEDYFCADLYDLTTGATTAEDTAEFPIEDLDEIQLQSLKLGAIFRWAVGFTKKSTGRQSKTSVLYFRKVTRKPEDFRMPIFAHDATKPERA